MRPDIWIDASSGLVEVSATTHNALLRDLEGRVRAGHGFAVATLNLDHVVKLRRDGDFRAAYGRHSHVVADGNPVVWLHRLAGRQVKLITGSDLVDPLMQMAARENLPVAFFGSTQVALDAAAAELAGRHPGLKVVARLAPSADFAPNSAEADASIASLAASGARICLVALGAPKQELFVARAIASAPNCGFVSVGAGLDFVAGTQRRAPKMMRRLALEWLWRLAGDPRRLAERYRDCAVILPGLVWSSLRARFRPRATVSKPPELLRVASRPKNMDR